MSIHRQANNRATSVQKVLGLMDQYILRNRFGAILLSAAIFFILKLWSVSSAGSAQGKPEVTEQNYKGDQVADLQVVEPLEILDRKTVLANRQKQGKKKGTMGRANPWKRCEAELADEDPAVMLRKHLESQMALESQTELQTEDLKLAWQALSKLYTARGLHKEALEAQKSARIYDKAEETDLSESGADSDLAAALFAAAEDEEELGALSFAQVGAAITKGPSAAAAAADAEAEVRKWLEVFGQDSCQDAEAAEVEL